MRRLLPAFVVFFLGLMAVAPSKAAPQKQKNGNGKTTKLSPIQVVGTGVNLHDVGTVGTVVVVPHREILERGVTSVEGLVKLLTVSGGAQNSQFNANGTGRTFADLHNLGAARTLVLVNGHRWMPTLFGPVDLSSIPLSIVDRVEVLLDGPSPVYGADAIAGVINIITKQNLNGASAGVYYGAYDAHGDGGGFDGKTYAAHALVGSSSDRSSVMVGVGYRHADPVWANDRTISREPVIGFGNLLGSTATPAGHLQIATNNPGAYAGQCDAGSQLPGFAYDCNLAGPFIGGGAHRFTVADRYNDAATSYIDTPHEQWYLFSRGEYQLNDSLSFDFMTEYERRNASEPTAPGAWPIGAQGNAAANGLPIGISATNPYNPFGVDLVPADPSSATFNQWCARYGAGPNGQCSSNYDVLQYGGFRPLGQGPQTQTQNDDNFYFNGGFVGLFPVFRNEWRYSLRYTYGQTLETEIRRGYTDTSRLQTALGPASQCTNGCVPLDLFGGSAGVTPAMLGYTNTDLHFYSDVVLRDYHAALDGDFYDGWYAGPWHMTAGYEYLEHDGVFQPDPLVSQGQTIGFPIQPSSGRKAQDSEFGQLTVPLLRGAFLARDLSVDVGDRFSQFRWSGGTTPSGGPYTGRAHSGSARFAVRWQPTRQVHVRGTWAQGIRVPLISELFGSRSQRNLPLIDPCVANQALPPSQQQTLPNCPNGGHGGASQPQSTIPVTTGGNPRLQPERGLTRTVSVTWAPAAVPRLHFSAAFYKIEVDGAVGTVNPQSLLDGCYLDNQSDYCSQVSRQGGAINNVLDTNINAGSIHTGGWDLGAAYGVDLGRGGMLWLSGTANFTRYLVHCSVVQGTGGPTSQCADIAGSVGSPPRPTQANDVWGAPKRRINLSADWRYGPWAVVWKTYVIGRMYEPCAASLAATVSSPPWGWCSNNAGGTNELGTTVYNDLHTSYTVDRWETTFTLGVNNFLDRSPPISMTASASNYLPVYYRVPGRFFYVRATVNF